MTKKIADSRLKRFVEIARKSGDEGTHPAARAVTRRPREDASAARVREFTRIERGHEA